MDNAGPGVKPGHFLIVFLFFLVFVGSIFPIADNDVWWHLKSGEYSVQHGEILRNDVFSYTIAGKDWIDHEWLSDVVFYGIYSLLSLDGITAFKALMALIIFMVMYLSSRGKEHILVWLIYAAAFLAMRDGLRERPQMFTYLFTAVYVFILRSGNGKAMWAIPFLQVLWANFHGAACFAGLGLVGLFAAFDGRTGIEKRLLLCAASAAAALVNPFGYRIFSYVLITFSQGLAGLILEFRGPVFSAQFIPFYSLLAVSAVSFPLAGRKPSWETAAVFLAAAGSLSAIRNIPIFAVIAAPLAAENLSVLFIRHRFRLDFNISFEKAGVLGAVLLMLFWAAGERLDVSGKYRFGLGDAHKARYAAEFIKWCSLAGFKGPIFNDYDFGGYLIWKLYPMQKVFIDGRLVEYGRGLAEKSFYFWKPDFWKELDGRYSFTAAVVPNERYYVCSYFDSMSEWVLVYWDDDALVYFKDMPQNRPFITKCGYRALKPNSPDQSYLKKEPVERALFEVERSLYFSPGSKKAAWMKYYLTTNRTK